MSASIDDSGTSPPPSQQALPKLRKGLTYTFSDYDYDGKPQWLVHDGGRNKFFIIGWPDYEMLMRWNLGSPDAVIDAVNSETTLNIDTNDVEVLIQFLAHNFLIEQTGKKIHQNAIDQMLYKDDNLFSWLVSRYLFFRIPIWHPDKFLTKTQKFGEFLFSRYLFYAMLILGMIALYQIGAKWDQFTGTFPSVISLRGLFFYFISFSIVKLLHEAGHAYRCKQYNIPVPAGGLAFLVFWPVLYTDTTLSWTLDSKKRMNIALAGIQVETYVTIIAALIWCNTSNLTLSTICYVTITVNWLSSLLINVSPFMRFDGYYVLSDLLKMPNLQYRAFALTRWQIRRWLFDWQDPPPEKFSRRMHNFLIIYSLLTWIYRLMLYIGIAVLVYYMFFKALGIILFFIEIYYFIIDPFVKEANTWWRQKEKFNLNFRTSLTIFLSLLMIAIFFVPFSESVELPATIHYAHQFLFAPEEGIIEKPLPAAGTPVKANMEIARLFSPPLNNAITKAQLQYEQVLSEARRASIDDYYANQKSNIRSNLDKKQSEYNKLREMRDKLVIKVSFSGILIDVASELRTGSYVQKNEWLGDVINPNILEVEAYISQIDMGLLKPGLSGYFYPEDLSQNKVPVTLRLIEPLNPTQLNCQYSSKTLHATNQRSIIETPCYNSSDFGGEIATFMSSKGEYVPVNSVHRAIFTTPDNIKISYIQRGHVVVKTKSRSYAYRFFYTLKRILVQEKDF